MSYISHLGCNAGVASFKCINWTGCICQLIRDPLGAVSRPDYYVQYVGEVGPDNFGWVWQSNVFGVFLVFDGHLLRFF